MTKSKNGQNTPVVGADRTTPQTDFFQKLDEKLGLSDFHITTNTIVQPRTYLGIFNGTPSLALANISAVTGQAKSCKSTFLKIITSSLCGTNRNFGIEPKEDLFSVIYMDTEQAVCDTKEWLTESISMGADENRLHTYTLRPFKKRERKDKAIAIMKELTIGMNLVIIDGLRDLISSPNDDIETGDLIDSLLATLVMRPNICLVCVLHQNPDTEKMRGHLGTELLNKLDSEWLCRPEYENPKDKNSNIRYYTATNPYDRKQARLQNPISFTFKNRTIVPIVPTATSMIADQWNRFSEGLEYGTIELKRKTIIDKIKHSCLVGSASSDSSAQRILDSFKANGYLWHSDGQKEGFYTYTKEE